MERLFIWYWTIDVVVHSNDVYLELGVIELG